MKLMHVAITSAPFDANPANIWQVSSQVSSHVTSQGDDRDSPVFTHTMSTPSPFLPLSSEKGNRRFSRDLHPFSNLPFMSRFRVPPDDKPSTSAASNIHRANTTRDRSGSLGSSYVLSAASNVTNALPSGSMMSYSGKIRSSTPAQRRGTISDLFPSSSPPTSPSPPSSSGHGGSRRPPVSSRAQNVGIGVPTALDHRHNPLPLRADEEDELSDESFEDIGNEQTFSSTHKNIPSAEYSGKSTFKRRTKRKSNGLSEESVRGGGSRIMKGLGRKGSKIFGGGKSSNPPVAEDTSSMSGGTNLSRSGSQNSNNIDELFQSLTSPRSSSPGPNMGSYNINNNRSSYLERSPSPPASVASRLSPRSFLNRSLSNSSTPDLLNQPPPSPTSGSRLMSTIGKVKSKSKRGATISTPSPASSGSPLPIENQIRRGSTDILRPSHPPPSLQHRTFSSDASPSTFSQSPGGYPIAWEVYQGDPSHNQGPPSAFPRRISGWISGVLSPSSPAPTYAGGDSLSPSPLPRTSTGSRIMQGKNSSVQSLSFTPTRRDRSVSPSPAPPAPPASSPPSTFRAPSPKKGPTGGIGAWMGLGQGGGLDKAVQFLWDTDSNGVGTGEEIWVLGVRHDGVVTEEEKEVRKKEKKKEKERMRDGEELEIVRYSASATPGGSKIFAGLPKRAMVKALPNAVTGGNKLMSSAVKLTSGRGDKRSKKAENQSTTNALRFREGWDRNASVSPPPSSSASTSSGPLSSMPFPPPTLAQTAGWPPSFYHDFYSRIALHYRSGFPVIPCQPNTHVLKDMFGSLSASLGRGGGPSGKTPEGLTSDAGWGCMLRTGQSLLANALERVHLGRDWRRPVPPKDREAPAPLPIVDAHVYQRLVSLFIDDPSPLAPFSVHKFAMKGKDLGKGIGEWFGPSTAARAIKDLTDAFPAAGLGVVNDIDQALYRAEVYEAAQCVNSKKRASRDFMKAEHAKPRWQRPVLVLFQLRLGLNTVNSIYFDTIQAIFRFPQSVGIAGGRPSSSYYFVGYQGASLFYIDPHHTRACVPLRQVPFELHQSALTKPLTTGRKDSDWEKLENPNDSGSFQSVNVHHSSPSPTSSSFGGFNNNVSQNQQEKEDPLDSFFAQAYPDVSLRTYHCEKVRRMAFTSLDPSMLVGFLIRDEADWEDFTARVKELPKPIISVQNEVPHWLKSKSAESDSASENGVESLSDPEDWDEEDATMSSKRSAGSNFNTISKENTPFSDDLFDMDITPPVLTKEDVEASLAESEGEKRDEMDDSIVSEGVVTLNGRERERDTDSWIDTGSTGGSVPSTARPNKTFNHDDSRPQSDYQTLLKDDENVLHIGGTGSGSIHSLEGWQKVEEKRNRKGSGLAKGWDGLDDDDDEEDDEVGQSSMQADKQISDSYKPSIAEETKR